MQALSVPGSIHKLLASPQMDGLSELSLDLESSEAVMAAPFVRWPASLKEVRPTRSPWLSCLTCSVICATPCLFTALDTAFSILKTVSVPWHAAVNFWQWAHAGYNMGAV